MSTSRSKQYRTHRRSSSDESCDQEIIVKSDQSMPRTSRGLHYETSKKRKFVLEDDSSLDADEYGHSSTSQHKSNRSGKSEAPTDMGATATINIDTQQDRDYQAVMQKARSAYESESGSKMISFQQQDGLRSKQRFGPQRAPSNVRATSRWDYAPDICKDYKETGTCGFGDSCKFLHDRSDHKFGWQLEAEYKAGTYGKDDNDSLEISEIYEKKPVGVVEDETCGVCRKICENPVILRCGHFYCETCFLGEVKLKKICLVCNCPTDGYVKYATKAKVHTE